MIPTNEQIVHDLATAWRTLNPELIIKHLATTFQYDSMEPVYYVIKIKDGKIVKGDLTAFVEFSELLE